MFDIDFDIATWQNLPVLLRQEIMFAWLKVLTSPVLFVYSLFMANRKTNLYFLAHNSQVCYMEAALNDLFDNLDREIYITDGPYKAALPVYIVDEEKPVFLDLESEEGTGVIPTPDPVPLNTIDETTGGVQFIVNVPTDIEVIPGYSEARLKALVNSLRLASKKNFTIQYF